MHTIWTTPYPQLEYKGDDDDKVHTFVYRQDEIFVLMTMCDWDQLGVDAGFSLYVPGPESKFYTIT